MADTAQRKAHKDHFDRGAAKLLAAQLTAVHPAFDATRFVRLASKDLSELEFADRVRNFSEALRQTLPSSVPAALRILTKSLPPPLPDCESVMDGWLQWPVGQFIADYGLGHYDASMQAMVQLTQRFSSEFAVRPFVEQYPDQVFASLAKLTRHKSPHVRRWCSEGVRPLLPWGKKLHALVKNPEPILPILDALKDDPELYVRRSVGNTLNDIAKHHPELVLRQCTEWSKRSTKERDWVLKQALRTLVKQGNPQALKLLGFDQVRGLGAELRVTPKKVKIGDSVELSATLSSTAEKSQPVLVDYVVHYVRKNGNSEKVFRWKQTQVGAGSTQQLLKKHPMKKTSIRALYPGKHKVELQVNGKRLCTASFTLTE